MSWIRKQIERLLAEARRRSRLLTGGIIAAVVAALVVTAALVQGATALSGDNMLKSASFSIESTGGTGTTLVSPNEAVAANSRVQFALTFEVPANSLTEADPVLTYTLPDGVEVSNEQGKIIGDNDREDQAGKNLGTYTIQPGDGNNPGTLTMTFSNNEVTNLYSEDLFTTVTFWATASNSSVNDQKDIAFPGVGTLVVAPVEPRIQISKAASKQLNNQGGDLADGADNKNRHVNYSITIATNTGTGNTVSLDDTMSSAVNVAVSSYDTGSFHLKKYATTDDEVGEDIDLSTYSPVIDVSDGHAHFKISNLPALNANERYTLSYSATITEKDHSADTSQTNTAVASINDRETSSTATANTQWGNRGDLSITKLARVTDDVNSNNNKERRIQYQIVVTTRDGSGTRIQIGDSASPNTNIDTSSWANNQTNSFYEHDSFKLRKYTGAYTNGQPIDPEGGTDEQDKLSAIAWNNDNGNPSFGLSISEPLSKGEYYVLTYTALVYESNHEAPDTTMDNNAVARIYPGGVETVPQQGGRAHASVTWHYEIQKTGTFNESTGYIDWSVQVNRNSGDATGIVMSDSLPDGLRLVSTVRVYRDNSNNPIKTLALLNGDVEGSSYNTDSRELRVVFGSWASEHRPYTIRFSTTAPPDGTVSNRAVMVRDGVTYGSGVGVGVSRRSDWGIAKASGSPTGTLDTSTGLYTMSWTATATIPYADLTPNGDEGVLKLTDTFGDVTQEDGTVSSELAGLHYAVAKDLYAELTGNTTSGTSVTLSLHNDADADGNARVYTLKNGVFTWGTGDQTTSLNGIGLQVTMYDTQMNRIDNPESSDAEVKRFEIVLTCAEGQTINGRSLTVSNYHSVVNATRLPASSTVNVGNTLVSNRGSGAISSSQSIRTLSNLLEKRVRTLNNRGDNSDQSFKEKDRFTKDWNSTTSGDYSSMSDGQQAAQFRIALNTMSYPDDGVVTITDTLPAGMVLATTTKGVPHPIRLMLGENIGLRNESYTQKAKMEGASTSDGPLSYSTDLVDGRQVVTFSLDLSKCNPQKGQYYITYTASYENDSTWNNLGVSERAYINTVTATIGALTYADSATLNVTRTVNPVQKSQAVENLANDRRGKYKIIINPASSDLNSNSDYVELIDNLTGWNTGGNAGYMNPVLDLNSVHLYRYNQNAEDGIGPEYPKSGYSLKYEYENGPSGYRRMRVTVPDSTALVLVYDYIFNAGEQGDWGSKSGDDRVASVSNTATLQGNTSNTVTENIKRADSGATGYTRALYLYKVDKDNHLKILGGSKFKLYKTDSSSVWSEVNSDIDGGAIDQSGTYHPSNILTAGAISENDVLYKLVETQAPAGYGRTLRYLVFLGSNETEDAAWTDITGSADGTASAPKLDVDGNQVTNSDGSAAKISRSDVTFVSYYGGNLYVEDEYQSITVTKNWAATDGTPLAADDKNLPASVTMQLKQRVKGSSVWVNYESPVLVSRDDGWQHTWSELPQSDGQGHEYEYKVEEVGADSHWKATYLNNDGISTGNITITNVRQYELPSTGGVPLKVLTTVGMATVLIAGALLAIRRVARR